MNRPWLDRPLAQLEADHRAALEVLLPLGMERQVLERRMATVRVAYLPPIPIFVGDMDAELSDTTCSGFQYDVQLKRYAWAGSILAPFHHRRVTLLGLEGLGFDVAAPPWIALPRNPPRRVLWRWWGSRYTQQSHPPDPFAEQYREKPHRHRRDLRRWKATCRQRFNRIPTPALRRSWRAAHSVPEHPWTPVVLQHMTAMTIGIDTGEHLQHPVAYHNHPPTPAHCTALPVLLAHAAMDHGLLNDRMEPCR